jgi:hypothetical protein
MSDRTRDPDVHEIGEVLDDLLKDHDFAFDFAFALGEIERLAAKARRIVTDDDLDDRRKRLWLLDLAAECREQTFPEAARQAVWLAVGDYLYGAAPGAHDLDADRSAWLRRAWIDEINERRKADARRGS